MRGGSNFGGLLAAAVLIGCGPGGGDAGAPQPPAQAPPSPAPTQPAAAPAPAGDPVAEAKTIFDTRCVTCHGKAGAGDGPGSAALTPKPRNFQDAAWQSSVTDAHIGQIVQYGGAAVGKSPTMPGNPDLMSKPEVVAALVAHIRGLGSP